MRILEVLSGAGRGQSRLGTRWRRTVGNVGFKVLDSNRAVVDVDGGDEASNIAHAAILALHLSRGKPLRQLEPTGQSCGRPLTLGYG